MKKSAACSSQRSPSWLGLHSGIDRQETALKISGEVIFLSGGKESGKWRGVFFALVGLLGMFKVFTEKRAVTPATEQAGDNPE